ncbi:lactadherin-like [Antedon mediterranea]|uniref:lactadherin-like n=1 Tax=Antedon mediterranea TaxID=105859 RepID=UPI003AF84A7C
MNTSCEMIVFSGNSDMTTPVRNMFPYHVYAAYIRIHPLDTNSNKLSMRIEILGCPGSCINPLGVEDGTIPNDQMTSSSTGASWKTNAYHGRLNRNMGSGAWIASNTDDYPWLQVHLGALKEVTGVITQGRPQNSQWVKSYQVSYSLDDIAFQKIMHTSSCEIML